MRSIFRVTLGVAELFALAAILGGCHGLSGQRGKVRGFRIHQTGTVRAVNRTRRNTVKKISFLTLLMTATLLFTLAFPAAAAGPKALAAPTAPAVAPAAPAVSVAT